MTIDITWAGVEPDVFGVLYGLAQVADAAPLPELYVAAPVADLYGLAAPTAFSLYGVDPHCDCNPMEFCRNPLHPGPCKGWKRTLGAVAPGALHALEKDRIAKAEERRKAAVKRYTDQGKKVPARLLKPITSKHLPGQGGAAPYSPPGGFQKPAGATKSQINSMVANRRADVAEIGKTSFLGKKASDRLDVYKTIKDGDVRAMTGAQRHALEGDLSQMAAKFKDPANKASAERILKQVKAVPKTDAQKAAAPSPSSTPNIPGAPASRAGQGKGRDGDGDGKKNEGNTPGGSSTPAAAPAAPAGSPAPKAASKAPGGGLAPAAPLPATASPAAKHAQAVAVRSAPRSRLSKGQVEAYSKLDKADYDALPDSVKAQIALDLQQAHAKFLDPKKQADVQAIQKKLGLPESAAHGKGASAAPARKAAAPSAPSAPAAPAAPSAPAAAAPNVRSNEAIHAADALDKINTQVTGRKLSDAALKRAADQWDQLDAAGRKKYADDFADKLSGGVVARLLQDRKMALPDKARVQLNKEIADHIAGGPPSPLLAHLNAALKDPDKVGELRAHLAREKLSDPVSSRFDKILAEPDAHTAARLIAREEGQRTGMDDAEKAAFNDAMVALRDDTTKPVWLRARAHQATDEFQQSSVARKVDIYDTTRAATMQPESDGSYKPDGFDMKRLFAANQTDIDQLHPVMQDAIKQRREEAIKYAQLQYGPNTTMRRDIALALAGGHPRLVGTGPALERYNALTDSTARVRFRRIIDDEVSHFAGQDNSAASAWQRILDDTKGVKHTPVQLAAIDAGINANGAMRLEDRLDTIEKLPKSDYDKLDFIHATAISDTLDSVIKHSPDEDLRVRAALKQGELFNTVPDHANPKTQAAALSAGLLAEAQAPETRLKAFTSLSDADFQELTPTGKLAVPQAMQKLVDDPASGLSLEQRGQLQLKHDALKGKTYDTEQVVAGVSSIMDPSKITDQQRLDAYEKLTWSSYDDLPRFFRDTIKDDLDRLKTVDPMAYDRIMQKIDPSYVPPTPTPAPTVHPPHVEAALDVVYGVDPKSSQSAHKMKVYSQVKGHEFGRLGIQEQQTILADLSHIATTTKSADAKARANKLLDRFTPAGTPAGVMPSNPPIIPGSSAVPNQTRYPDPGGRLGVLKESTNPGKRGDEWMTVQGSSKRVWGKYGAAGLLLRHVDPQTGEQRFLIAQRGPAISNPGLWQLPGGAIESNESYAEGATRETLEELGFAKDAFKNARVHGHHEAHVANVAGTPTGDWKYTSFATDVDDRLKPDLSTASARAETSDARWMTLAEIEDLDRQGKILGPLAGGQLQRNIISLFPPAGHSVTGPARPGPVTRRPGRLSPSQRGQVQGITPSQTTPHKPSTATNLVQDHAAAKALLDKIKGPVRASYRGKTADERLAAINAIQGHDRTPTVVNKAEMDRLLATGDYIEVWRGISDGGGKTAKEIAEQFRSGSDYGGLGIFGNGYYFARDKALAESYASGGWRGRSGGGKDGLVRALMPKSALTQKYDDVKAEAEKMPSSSGSRGYHAMRASMGGGTLHDPGRYAAAKGLTAIEIPASQYRMRGGAGHLARNSVFNIVNRSILIVEEGR
jgi:8-oxo-dGTP pyrophosphatase MutT (NUDIX family)